MAIHPPQRLLLRLGTQCNNGCAHCTVADLRARHGERTTESLRDALAAGRSAGCVEVVFLRGEPTLREDFTTLCVHARKLGYTLIQAQTNGRLFSLDGFVERMVAAGLTHAEVSLYGPTPGVHDAISQAPGSFEQTREGLRRLAAQHMVTQVNVPIVRRNADVLADTVAVAADAGARRIQLNFQRPLDENPADATIRLDACAAQVREAIVRGEDLGVRVMTEAFPICLLGPHVACASDAWTDAHAPAIRIDDLERIVDDVAGLRAETRARPDVCRTCRHDGRCPTTWTSYVDRHGTAELRPVSTS